jgi:hypothetical protein
MVLQEPCLLVQNWSCSTLSSDQYLTTYINPNQEDPHHDFGTAWEDTDSPYAVVSSVCRQVYYETCLLPYALNTFTFNSHQALTTWIDCRLPIDGIWEVWN